jgi:hypothetical protein
MQLVRSRTSHILAVENMTALQHGNRITSNQVKRLDEQAIDQMNLPDDVALAVRAGPPGRRAACIATRLILMGVWRDSSQPRFEETGALSYCHRRLEIATGR